MKRVAIAFIALALLLPAEAATGGGQSQGAKALVKIGGPARLRAARLIQFPLYCSQPCFVKVTVKLFFPGPDLVSTVSTTIEPGRPKVDRLTLNGPATENLKQNYRQSHLEVVASARNLETNARDVARRAFRFYR